VTYDHRSLIIDGRRRLLISTSIHYPRSVPAVSSCTPAHGATFVGQQQYQ
jgi:hypothetical protein